MAVLKKMLKPVWVRYPKYPAQVITYNDELGSRDVVFVVCRKYGLKSFNRISLEVCLKSIFRFNPKSKNCRRCIGIGKGEPFPKEFLEAKKEIHFKESLLALKNMEKFVEEE